MKRRPRLPNRLLLEISRNSRNRRSYTSLPRKPYFKDTRKEARKTQRKNMKLKNRGKAANLEAKPQSILDSESESKLKSQSDTDVCIPSMGSMLKRKRNDELQEAIEHESKQISILNKKLGVKQSRTISAMTMSQDQKDSDLEEFSSGVPKSVCDQSHQENQRYIAPCLKGKTDLDATQKTETVKKKVRGLLNRLSEGNIKGITHELTALYQTSGRTSMSSIFAKEIVKAAAEGPKTTSQLSAISAAAIAAFSALSNSHEVTASFLSHLALQLESSYKQKDSLACLNLISLLCQVHLSGLISCLVLYGVLNQLIERMQDLDVSLMHTILQLCGLRLRSEDSDAMKTFIIDVHNKAALLAQKGELSQRAEIMLDLVIDVKNNKLSKTGKSENLKRLSPGVDKWLQELDVKRMILADLTWEQICSLDKSGRWWLPDSQKQSSVTKSVLPDIKLEQENGLDLLALAVKQKMNTGLRKSIFCIIMGSQDSIDACEKLIRLPLKGEQEREILRVLVECCLQEKRWNPYYSKLAFRLCKSKKGHSITLQFCLKDKFKLVDDMEVRQMDHIAKLAAGLIHQEVLPLSMMKSFNLSSELTKKRLFFLRIFILHLLLGFENSEACLELFSKLGSSESMQIFGKTFLMFLKLHFERWLSQLEPKTMKWLAEHQLITVLERYHKLTSLLKSIVQ